MKKVLVVSYYFPPMAGGGVYRMLKFCKFLPKFNWQPVVLCPNAIYFPVIDETLLDVLPQGLKIYRTLRFDQSVLLKIFWKIGLKFFPRFVNEYFFFPDEHITWFFYAVWEGLKIIRREKIDVVLASHPPPTSLVVGYALSILTNKPLVIDFRDEWAETKGINFPTTFHKVLNLKLQKKIIEKAVAVIAVNDVLLENLRALSKNERKIWKCITNGYDPDDFKIIEKFTRNENKFTIAYMGAIYPDRTGKQFFHAVEDLINSKEIDEDKIELVTIGPDFISKFIPRFKWIRNFEYVKSFSRAFGVLSHSDLLLEFAPDRNSVVRGKIFEYLYLKKPILALLNKDSAEAYILKESSDDAIIVDVNDRDEIKTRIKEIYQKWQNKELPKEIKIKNLEKYHRKNLCRALSETLNHII